MVARTRFSFLLALTLVLCALPVIAQERVRFDMRTHLAGYEKTWLSEYAELVDWTYYNRFQGKLLDASELDVVRERWREDLLKLWEAIGKSGRATRDDHLRLLEKQIEGHKYFSQINWDRVDRYAPFVLYIQRHQKERPNWVEVQSALYGPFLQELEQIFAQELATQIGIEQSAGEKVYPLFVLTSRGEFIDYMTSARDSAHVPEFMHFDQKLGLATIYDNPKTNERNRRRRGLHAATHLLLHGHATRSDEGEVAPIPAWLDEGLARDLSFLTGRDPQSLRERALDTDALRAYGRLRADQRLHRLYVRPASEIARYSTDRAFVDAAARRAAELSTQVQAQDGAVQAFHAQATLVTHFLCLDGEGGYRPHLNTYLKRLFAGESGADAYRATFPEAEREALDAAFLAWVREQYKSLPGSPRFPGDPVAAGDGLPVTGSAAPVPNAENPGELGGPAFQPADVLCQPLSDDARLGFALVRAVRGDVDTALVEIDAMLAGQAVDVDRLTLERGRIAAWKSLRNAFLERLQQSGKKLRIDVRDRTHNGVVQEITEDSVVLVTKSNSEVRIPLARLDPLELARQIKGEAGLEDDWARYWPYVAGAHSSWKRLISRKDGEEFQSLERDGDDFYPAAMRLGRAAEALLALSRWPMPADADEASETLDAIIALRTDHASEAPVSACDDQLRAFAAVCSAKLFESQDLDELLYGKVEELTDGVLRITYDFRDDLQLNDFESDPGLLADMRPKDPLAPGARSPMAMVTRGAMMLRGAGALSHVLDFEAPMNVSYRVVWRDVPGEAFSENAFAAGVCGDAFGNFVWMRGLGYLRAMNRPDRFQQQATAAGGATIYIGTSYALELRHDGTSVESYRDGVLQGRVECGGRTSGRFFLWHYSDLRVELRQLVIEAKLVPASMRRLERRFVRQQLRELGFD